MDLTMTNFKDDTFDVALDKVGHPSAPPHLKQYFSSQHVFVGLFGCDAMQYGWIS
jgi:hypothetical protein